jgi:hypothetical protein
MLPTAGVAGHLGEVLWKLKRRDQARKVWQEGFKKDPHDDTLLKTLKRFRVTFK